MIPDVTPLLRDFLRADAAVSALVAARVYAVRIPAKRAWPCVLITPLSQLSVTPHVERSVDAQVQLEVYGRDGDDWAHTWLIAATAQARMRHALPSYTHPAGHVSAVLPEAGLQFLPDDEHGVARCVTTVRLIAYQRVAQGA